MRGFLVLALAASACTAPSPDFGVGDLARSGADLTLPATCSNWTRDVNETDVDCGGSCAPCGTGRFCLRGTDCESGTCDNNACAGPSCDDERRNGDESDVDCGGTACARCAEGKACRSAMDCASANCAGGRCGASLCANGVRDGDETDADCGGMVCPKCGDGAMCLFPTDCASGRCLNNLCVSNASCMDGIKNGDEMDVDCGGKTCPKCGPGKCGCVGDADCASSVCRNGCCVAPSCSDNVKNGAETDVDCGGAACPKCGAGRACAQGTDCTSGKCMGMKCTMPPPLTLGFDPPASYPTELETSRLLTGAVDGDKFPDLVILGSSGNKELVALLGNPDGTFRAPVKSLGGTLGLYAVGDFNRDGKGDVMVKGGNNVFGFAAGNGGGVFGPQVVSAAPALPPAQGVIPVGDWNLDGKLDIGVGAIGNGFQSMGVALGRGDGTFHPPSALPLPPVTHRAPWWFAPGDLDGDGKLDLFAITHDGMGALRATWALGKGDGDFLAPATTDHRGAWAAGIADFTGDGKADLVLVANVAFVLPGNGDGTFKKEVMSAVGGGVQYLGVADFNLDGKMDLATCSGGFLVSLGKGDGTFEKPHAAAMVASVLGPVVADFNRDGRPDLAALVVGQKKVVVLLNASK